MVGRSACSAAEALTCLVAQSTVVESTYPLMLVPAARVLPNNVMSASMMSVTASGPVGRAPGTNVVDSSVYAVAERRSIAPRRSIDVARRLSSMVPVRNRPNRLA